MTRNAAVRTVALCALAAALAARAHAQSAGSITGAVRDTSGGALPGATVTATNRAQAVTQDVRTDAEGVFIFLALPPGTYAIKAELSGFKSLEKSNVILTTKSSINAGAFVLEVGNVTETITVEANVGRLQVQSESAERSDLVTNKQLRDVALNGRNIVDLFKIIPGVIAGGTQTTSTVTNVVANFNINGTRNDQHEYTVDGVTNLNLGNNTGALVTINPDAVEEVKVLSSNYQAEYGRAGGGFIALTTRSGTNEYHGGARYFRRHDSLNANTYFNNARGGSDAGFPRPLYRYNYYGWDLGGPVPFVGHKQDPKLFFFASQEYYDQLVPQASSINRRVPTQAERNGDFSQTRDGNGNLITIRDPLTGQPFPGNVIPASRIYGPGRAILNVFPGPNATAGGNVYNYSSQDPSEYPRREDIVRLDWQIASATRLSARFIYNKDEQRFAYGTTTASWDWPLTITKRENGPGKTLSLTLNHSFGPSLHNEFVFAAGRGGVNIGPADDKYTRASTGINVPLLYGSANAGDAMPTLSFDGNPTATVAVANQTFAETNFNGTPFHQTFVINNFMDNLTKSWGKHTFKAGVYYQRANNQRTSFGPVQANIDFSNNTANPFNTGHPYANALLGIYTSYSQASIKLNNNFFYQDLSGYLQDTWKVTPRLTLDLGVRLSHYQPIYDKEDQLSFFNPDLYSAARAPRIYRGVCVTVNPCVVRALDPAVTAPPTAQNTLPPVFVGRLVPNSGDLTNGLGLSANGYPRGGFDAKAVLPQPRLGFAWDAGGDRKTVVRGGFGITYDRIRTDVIADAITNPPTVLTPTLFYGTLQDIAGAASTGALAITQVVGMDEAGEVPTVYSYSVGVQRDIGRGIVVDVAYVGSQSRHNPRQRNLNALPYGRTFQASAQDPTRFAGGVVPAVEPGLPAAHRDAGLNFSGQFALPIDFLRPYQGYGDILFRSFDAAASYNSLQASVQRRFSKSFTFGLSYTLSRAESTSDVYNANTHVTDPEGYDYALASFDRTHYLVANYVWTLPRGSKLLGGGGFARALLDNWTFSGISWIASGNPAELTLSISGQDAGNRMLGTYAAGNSSAQQPRFRLNGDGQGAANDINLEAFSVPGIGDVGPYPRMYLRNPGINNHDWSLFKNIPFGGGRRYLQLRIEAFNVFNHPQFSNVNRTTNLTTSSGATGAAVFNSFSNLQITNNTRPAGSTAPLGQFFGEYNTARDPRIVQLGVKLYF
jgi:outer membrane receptor protein involved in Fe transport